MRLVHGHNVDYFFAFYRRVGLARLEYTLSMAQLPSNIITDDLTIYTVDAANSLSPSPIPSHTLSRGTPGGAVNIVYKVKYDTSKSDRILGLKYRTKEDVARDTLADFESRGW